MRDRLIGWVLSAFLVAASASAQIWTEIGDAPSFPDGNPQVTRGDGPLRRIDGTTGGDARDAYCILITDPASFLATTDPNTTTGATASFDSRLFLFRPDRYAQLANDDTAPGDGTGRSTLTNSSTQFPFFTLAQPGEHILVVAGSADSPVDSVEVKIFDLASNLNGVHAWNPAAGVFERWMDAGTPDSGSYSVELEGVEYCQHRLDAVFANNIGFNGTVVEKDRQCLGDGGGGFACEDVSGDQLKTQGVALGFVDKDRHLDAVFAVLDFLGAEPNRLCLNDGSGGFNCSDTSALVTRSTGVAVGLVNETDQHLDIIFSNAGVAEHPTFCSGDGLGGFQCVDIPGVGPTSAAALGLVNDDHLMDIVFVHGIEAKVCLGLGLGLFNCLDIGAGTFEPSDVAVGDFNGDQRLDAVFAVFSTDHSNRVCLGQGDGSFVCDDVSAQQTFSYGVDVGYVDGDSFLDVVFAINNEATPPGDEGLNRLCLGDGLGGFTCSDFDTGDRLFSNDVALGLVDGDEHLDAVFAKSFDNPPGTRNTLCLGDGLGGFTCVDVSSDALHSSGVALGDLSNALLFIDGFESGDTSAWTSTRP